MKTVRIFVSSPGDVAEERTVALSVLRWLQGSFQGRLVLVPILWEQEPLLASAGFQQEIDRRAPPRATDIAVFVLWSRLGTLVSKDFVLEDGRRPTGTEWEFADAFKSHVERGAPDILVYRRAEPPEVKVTAPDYEARRADYRSVEAFFESRFRNAEDLSFKGSYHRYHDAAHFGRILQTHLEKVLTERLAGAQGVATWHGSPFRGLEAFEPEHARVFFGRTRARQEVRQALARQVKDRRAFVLILGPSGNGKSSLARAGLLPMLDAPWVAEEELGSGICRRAVMTPGAERTPLQSMAAALLDEGALPDLKDSGDPTELAALFARSAEFAVSQVRGSLRRVAKATVRDGCDPPPARLVLLVDQMEELFTREGVTDADREAFARVLDALARSGDAWILATLRSDHYPSFSRWPLLMALKDGGGHYDLALPEASETAEIIRGPAQVAGLHYESDAASGRVLDDVLLAEAMKGPDALPLLEYALTQLEQRRSGQALTFEAYRAMGGLEGAIRERAERTWEALAEEAQGTFPTVLRGLVEVGDGGARAATRRRAPYNEVTRTTAAQALVEAFVAARLLVAEGEGAAATVKLAHETLVRAWPRAADRIAAEEELLRIRSRVRTQAARWAQEARRGDLLLTSGKPMGEALLLRSSGFELTDVEADYLTASVARARRARTAKRVAVGAVGLLAAATTLLALLTFRERDEKSRALDDVLRLADSRRVRDLRDQAESFRPLQSDLEATTAAWMGVMRELAARRSEHTRRLAELRESATGAGPPWRFADGALAWQHDLIRGILDGLDGLEDAKAGALARVRELHAHAKSLRASLEANADAWRETIEAIASEPMYRGLRIVPQRGLVPLGRDPDSGLFEFAHLGSGSLPVRSGTTGRFVRTDDFALVFVLIPGGTFWMGAQGLDPKLPGYEPQARDVESPVRSVTLSAFLLSKYECTQAQWAALASGATPSLRKGPRLPVEQVVWEDALGTLSWYGLSLPSEAQWEYACRAGTTTGWWSGRDEQGLGRAAWTMENSGLKTHRVGEKAANGFGLHDIHGNVAEWCADRSYVAYAPGSPTDPIVAQEDKTHQVRVIRGGSWVLPAEKARSAFRFFYGFQLGSAAVGLRPSRAVTLP